MKLCFSPESCLRVFTSPKFLFILISNYLPMVLQGNFQGPTPILGKYSPPLFHFLFFLLLRGLNTFVTANGLHGTENDRTYPFLFLPPSWSPPLLLLPSQQSVAIVSPRSPASLVSHSLQTSAHMPPSPCFPPFRPSQTRLA